MLPLPFSVGEIVRFCEFLETSGQIERLSRFLWSLPETVHEIVSCEDIIVARAVVASYNCQFQELSRIIEGNNFSRKYHEKLQNLWYKARYCEAERCKGRPLDAVAKYRVRRKFPAPRTISDGREKSYCFQGNIRVILSKAYEQKSYPCVEDKRKLAEQTGLTVTQVSNWFKNKRQRIRITQQRKRETARPWPLLFNNERSPCLMCHKNISTSTIEDQYLLRSNTCAYPIAVRPDQFLCPTGISDFATDRRSVNHGQSFPSLLNQ